ncbi:MAG: TetR family transcriptional regulator [Kutzneria sp.]|nr:TetR family transcriptional regulator [Kutzneria sp.]MBV9847149.1 TetR family transcriptional regulator [Kutzneria sp.]
MTRPPSTAAKVDRRRALVQAAFDQIAQRGLEGLRLRAVAVAAGLDHSSLHHYFPTKEDLIASVVEYTTAQLWPTLRSGRSPADRIRRHLRLMAHTMRERPELFVVLCELNLRAARDPAIRAIIDRGDQDWRAFITAQLSDGAWHRAYDAAAGAELIIASIKGATFNPDTAATALRQLERLLTDQE